MIDESRLVSPDGGIDHDLIINFKEECMVLVHLFIVIASQGLVTGNTFSDVLDNPLPFANAADGKCAKSGNG